MKGNEEGTTKVRKEQRYERGRKENVNQGRKEKGRKETSVYQQFLLLVIYLKEILTSSHIPKST